MSTEEGKVASKEVRTIDGIISPEDTAKIARNFVKASKAFSSDQGFRDVAELIDRIPKLEKDIQEKEKKLKRVSDDLENEKTTHVAELKRSLQLYGEESHRFENDRAAFKQRIENLQEEIVKKETSISEHEKTKEELKSAGRKCEEAYKIKSTKLKEKESEIIKIIKQVEESQDEIGKLSTQLEKMRSQVSVQEQSLKQAEQRNARLDGELEATRGELENLQKYSEPLKNTNFEVVANELDEVWNSATSLVRETLTKDLSEDQLKNSWNALNNAARYIMDTPLPQSNSAIAKELRIIAVLGILADLIDSYMFQPTYLLPEASRFGDLLRMLAAEEPEKERFLRGMMLSILQDRQEDAEEHLVKQAVRELIRVDGVEEIISSASIADFRHRLEEILENAQETWRAIQYSKDIFVSEFKYTQVAGHEWQSFNFQAGSVQEGADAASPTATHDVEDDFVVLFPRIDLIQDGVLQPITVGTVVRKSRIRNMIREDRENDRTMDQPMLRSRNRQGRAMSMSTEGARGGHVRRAFLPQAAAST